VSPKNSPEEKHVLMPDRKSFSLITFFSIQKIHSFICYIQAVKFLAGTIA